MLLCLITNYRFIFLWKAHMAAKITTPPPPFQYGKSLIKSLKNIFIFVSKTLKFYTEYQNNDLIVKLLNRILDQNSQTNSKWRPLKTKYHVTKHLKMMMILNCCVQMHAYSTE